MVSEYLVFRRHELPGRKTPIVEVRSRSSGDLLGTLRWYGPWRQFCFYPEPLTIFNNGCLQDVRDQITDLMEERRG